MKIQKSDWAKIIAVSIIFFGGMIVSYQILKPKPRLPIYNPADLDQSLVEKDIQRKGRDHRVKDFSLLSQTGDSISQAQLKGKIYVADFFFTTCPGICRDMAKQKRRLQEVYKDDDLIRIVSHSVTPEIDSLEVLQEYAERQGAIAGKWYLLTGDKVQIYSLARRSYFAVQDQGGNGDESDFIHTENFVLIDQKKRIRGFYDGTSESSVDQLIKDIEILKNQD